MSDFHEGRVAATFQVGAQIEGTKEAYEKEILGLEGMKAAMVGVVKSMEDYHRRIQIDRAQGKLPLKEGDVALKYVSICLEQMQKMYQEVEAKRNTAIGACRALERAVADIKAAWDKETMKLKEIQEFESKKPHDMKERPVGYMPQEKPLDEYKEETEKRLQDQSDKVTSQETENTSKAQKRPRRHPAEGKPPRQ
jgi:hypothetical protein